MIKLSVLPYTALCFHFPFSKPFTLYGCNLFQALRFHFKAEILTFPVLSTLFLFTSIWEFKVSMPKRAKNYVFSWCHSVTRLFRKSVVTHRLGSGTGSGCKYRELVLEVRQGAVLNLFLPRMRRTVDFLWREG